MRLFIALEFPSAIIDYLGSIQCDLRTHHFFDGRYVKPEQLHSTLAFFSGCSQNDVEKFIQQLEALTVLPFEVTLGSLDVDDVSKPRVVWVNLVSDHLTKTAHVFRKGNEKPFRPHGTLARIKKVYNKQGLLDYVEQYTVQPHSFMVDALVLKRSQLTRTGPTYETLFTRTLSSL